MGEVARQNVSQPGGQLCASGAAKIPQCLMRLQQRLLDQVGCVELSLQAAIKLHPGQESQVLTILLQVVIFGRVKLAHGVSLAHRVSPMPRA
jgi:hypothetical protein